MSLWNNMKLKCCRCATRSQPRNAFLILMDHESNGALLGNNRYSYCSQSWPLMSADGIKIPTEKIDEIVNISCRVSTLISTCTLTLVVYRVTVLECRSSTYRGARRERDLCGSPGCAILVPLLFLFTDIYTCIVIWDNHRVTVFDR